MAVMIPEIPNPFQTGSLEDVMFEALKSLPDSYMVFHSFRLTDVKDGILNESETDFIIFDRERGILCLEAKAGAVSFQDGRWMYGNGTPMRSGGPFRQAAANKWKLMELIGNSRLGFLTERIKFLHGVWFPSISDERIDEIDMPPEADRKIVLGRESFCRPSTREPRHALNACFRWKSLPGLSLTFRIGSSVPLSARFSARNSTYFRRPDLMLI